MSSKIIRKLNLGKYNHKNLLFSSAITLGILYPTNVLTKPLLNLNFNEINKNSNKSFITKAVEKTGPSVVTIDTQRYVRNRRFSRDSQLFLDPIGQDFFTDIAVLKIEGKGPWPKAKLGNSTKIKVGDWAIAVGNPFGLENTVTLGIISNLKRNVAQLGIYDKKLELIQTDAAINPGNSGGPLLNSNGEVIGINTLIRSGPGAGLSFAIPINKAKEVAYQLINNGKVIHPMIGVNLIDDSNLETNNNRVIVGYVVPKSPAEKSGILRNDIILKVGNKDIEKVSDVVREINKNGINKHVEIILKRKNKFIKLKVLPTDITNIKNN